MAVRRLSAIAIAIGVVGTLYYYRQLQAVIRRRQEAGIDLEEDDGDDDPRDRGNRRGCAEVGPKAQLDAFRRR